MTGPCAHRRHHHQPGEAAMTIMAVSPFAGPLRGSGKPPLDTSQKTFSLSTQEAADLLRISRTTLVRLPETGVIPFDKPSRHRKVRLDDLLEYRRRQRSQAELAFADMVADTERLGLYDADPAQARAALQADRRRAEG
jgi:excisionase family DNA binding protein